MVRPNYSGWDYLENPPLLYPPPLRREESDAQFNILLPWWEEVGRRGIFIIRERPAGPRGVNEGIQVLI